MLNVRSVLWQKKTPLSGCVFLGKSKNGFCLFLAKSKNGSWIQSIHTRGDYFGLNLNPDFEIHHFNFFGKRFILSVTKNEFVVSAFPQNLKEVHMQRFPTTCTCERLKMRFTLNKGNFACNNWAGKYCHCLSKQTYLPLLILFCCVQWMCY